MKQNIWILNHYAGPPDISGGIRHYKFAENLISKAYKVKIYAASSNYNSNENLIQKGTKFQYKKYNGVPFIFIKARDYAGNGIDRVLNMIEFALGLISVSKKFDAEKPDIIYASSVHPLTWLSGYRLAKRYKAKFIAETRDLWPETLVSMGQIKRNSIPAWLLYKLEEFIYKKADKLVFTIPGGKNYVESIGLDASKVIYISNGVDLEEFNQNKALYVTNDRDLANMNIFKVIYTGAMGQANALGYLLEAAEIIQNKGINNIKFFLYGDGYQKHKLIEYVKTKGISNVVFRDRVKKKYVPEILSKADINLLTGKYIELYNYGLSPNKLFEYFASGKPTVSNIQCRYDIIEEFKCGITVEGGSAEALAEGILKFYNMTEAEYATYGNNALRAAKEFDYKTLTDKLEKALLE